MPLNLPRHGADSNDIQAKFERLGSEHLDPGMTKEAMYTAPGNMSFAVPRYFDPRYDNPMGYNQGRLDLANNEEQRRTLQEWMRVFYDTHPIVGSIIDMYSRFPVSGLELVCDDLEVKRFFEELFLADLDYEQLLIDMGREFWMIGEVAAFGSWDPELGIWTNEDLLDTASLEVTRVPFSTETHFNLTIDPDTRALMTGGTPEAFMFKNEQPELYDLISRGESIPISDDNLFWGIRASKRGDLRGTPILLRAINTLKLEERMMSAMEATAERLYSPMIMFKLGMKMDNGQPLMPTPQMINQFKQNFNAALQSDFRAIFTHFMVDEKELFSNTRISNWKQDWDMFDEKIYACFGMSADMIQASKSQTYASTALRFDLISQYMKTHQNMLIKFYNKRAAKVAEAQEFYVTDETGEVVMERYKTIDPDTGEEVVVEKPKLLYPELKMKVINFKDDEQQRQFLNDLRRNDIPIAGQDMAIGVDIDLQSSAAKLKEEKIYGSVLEAETHEAILKATAGQGLPIPPATKKFFMDGVMPKRYQPWFDGDIVPVNDEGPEDGDSDITDQEPGIFDVGDENKQRPEVSDERREDMPKRDEGSGIE